MADDEGGTPMTPTGGLDSIRSCQTGAEVAGVERVACAGGVDDHINGFCGHLSAPITPGQHA